MQFNGNILRHEQKYVIGYQEYNYLYPRLAALMRRDPHCGDGGYHIRSLYFDDVYNTAYSEKLSGVEYRQKYRVRIYDKNDGIIKLERKDKFADFISKQGYMLTKDEFYAISNGGDISFLLSGKSDSMPAQMFGAIRTRLLRPAVIVDYRRDVFICTEGNVRITFDRDIQAGIDSYDIFSDVHVVNALEPYLMVLEVKFDDYLPGYIKKALSIGAGRHEAVSKYVCCRETQIKHMPSAAVML